MDRSVDRTLAQILCELAPGQEEIVSIPGVLLSLYDRTLQQQYGAPPDILNEEDHETGRLMAARLLSHKGRTLYLGATTLHRAIGLRGIICFGTEPYTISTSVREEDYTRHFAAVLDERGVLAGMQHTPRDWLAVPQSYRLQMPLEAHLLGDDRVLRENIPINYLFENPEHFAHLSRDVLRRHVLKDYQERGQSWSDSTDTLVELLVLFANCASRFSWPAARPL